MKRSIFLTFTLIFLFMMEIDAQKMTKVLIHTDLGDIKIGLYNDTPLHRDNFTKLAKEGFYDGSIFHRVIKGFMVQGGAAPAGKPEAAKLIPAEILPNHIHKKGALAAARTNNPKKESSGSQFYIVQGSKVSDQDLNQFDSKRAVKYTAEQRATYTSIGGTPFLDMEYTVFGEVLEGLDVIDKIAAVQTAPGDKPVKDIKMTMKVIRKK
ncbi:MAG: peptidylprolyl isomerase [Bacteroidota bacterium]